VPVVQSLPDASLTVEPYSRPIDEENTSVNDEKSRGARKEGSKTDPDKPRSYQSGSFLVRFWVEPSDSGEQVLRGCIKNLKTGQEHYVDDPGKVGDLVRGHLKDRERAEEKSSAEGKDESGTDPTWAGRH
jgi:hypothetical protein